MALIFSAIKWHTHLGGHLGPNPAPCKAMALWFGSPGVLQPKQLLKCCVTLLATTWIAGPTSVQNPASLLLS